MITQSDYLNYAHALRDLEVIYVCHKKEQWGSLCLIDKMIAENTTEGKIDLFTWQEQSVKADPLGLAGRVKTINQMHAKLKDGLKEPQLGEYPLAADLYNQNQKIINVWNSIWEKHHAAFLIDNTLSPLKVEPLTEDEKALNKYFDLLKKHPELQRAGELNDYHKGAYQILYEQQEIEEVRGLVYKRLLEKTGSAETASQGSRVGVVFEDPFWIIVRDAVISPQNFKHTYNRLIWKSQLTGNIGAAVMPLIKLPTGEIKVSLVLNYRHAIQSFEFELPRGGSKAGETPEQTALRELREETGFEIAKAKFLGSFPPDSGVMSSIVPVFSGMVLAEKSAKHDKTEAIQGKYLFSIEEIKAALRSPDKSLEVMIGGEKKRYPLRDPFLMVALCSDYMVE